MRRRLYFVLPDVESARRTADDLLLARIEDRHIDRRPGIREVGEGVIVTVDPRRVVEIGADAVDPRLGER